MDPQAETAGRPPVRSTWRVLLGYARPHWRMLMLGGVLSLATAATGLALPLVVRELISTLGSVDGSVAGLVALMTALVLANAAIGVAIGALTVSAARRSILYSPPTEPELQPPYI